MSEMKSNNFPNKSEAGQYLNRILDASANGIMAFHTVRNKAHQIIDFEWRFVNQKAEAITGKSQADLIGKRLLSEMPEFATNGLYDCFVEVVQLDTSREYTYSTTQNGKSAEYQVSIVKLDDGVVATFTHFN